MGGPSSYGPSKVIFGGPPIHTVLPFIPPSFGAITVEVESDEDEGVRGDIMVLGDVMVLISW